MICEDLKKNITEFDLLKSHSSIPLLKYILIFLFCCWSFWPDKPIGLHLLHTIYNEQTFNWTARVEWENKSSPQKPETSPPPPLTKYSLI